MKNFASLLGEYIEVSGMKQTRIASSAHISYNYLIRLLAGDRHPSEPVVYKLAEALRLSAEQAGELLATAGYAPSLALIQSPATHEQITTPEVPSTEVSQATRFVQQFYRLAQEVPGDLQDAFLEEMKHLLGYARYKYVFSGGANLLDLNLNLSHASTGTPGMVQPDQLYLNLIAQLVGELQTEPEEISTTKEDSSFLEIGDTFLDDDIPVADHFVAEMQIEKDPSQFVRKMFTVLQEGASWDVRYLITKAFAGLCRLDVPGTEQLMNVLRLDKDELHGTDIRRRVVEALPALFEASPLSLPTIMRLLHPVAEDDIYVALATVEVCGDIQDRIKQLLEGSISSSSRKKSLESEKMAILLQKYQAEIPRIQRQLLAAWEGIERECIQFSLVLHDLLRAPDTMLLSLREGLDSPEKLIQFVTARFLERLLPIKPLETLELYKLSLQGATGRNVRRSVARALPGLLRCLEETSLPTRTLARTIISTLATDPDIYIRRAVADHLMYILLIDREFLLVLLRRMQKDTDQTVRQRLQSVALHLAQVWLAWYAEAAGLIDTPSTRRARKPATALPHGNEVK